MSGPKAIPTLGHRLVVDPDEDARGGELRCVDCDRRGTDVDDFRAPACVDQHVVATDGGADVDGYLRFDHPNVGYVIDGIEDATVRYGLERDIVEGDRIELRTPNDVVFAIATVEDAYRPEVRHAWVDMVHVDDRSHPSTGLVDLLRQLHEHYEEEIRMKDPVTVIYFDVEHLGGDRTDEPVAVTDGGYPTTEQELEELKERVSELEKVVERELRCLVRPRPLEPQTIECVCEEQFEANLENGLTCPHCGTNCRDKGRIVTDGGQDERYGYSTLTDTWYRVTEYVDLGDGKIQAKEKEEVPREDVPEEHLDAVTERVDRDLVTDGGTEEQTCNAPGCTEPVGDRGVWCEPHQPDISDVVGGYRPPRSVEQLAHNEFRRLRAVARNVADGDTGDLQAAMLVVATDDGIETYPYVRHDIDPRQMSLLLVGAAIRHIDDSTPDHLTPDEIAYHAIQATRDADHDLITDGGVERDGPDPERFVDCQDCGEPVDTLEPGHWKAPNDEQWWHADCYDPIDRVDLLVDDLRRMENAEAYPSDLQTAIRTAAGRLENAANKARLKREQDIRTDGGTDLEEALDSVDVDERRVIAELDDRADEGRHADTEERRRRAKQKLDRITDPHDLAALNRRINEVLLSYD